VTVRELRNKGGEVLDRVARGESFVVTRDGPVAEPSPLRRRSASPAELMTRRRGASSSRPSGAAPRRRRSPGCASVSAERGLLDTSTVILLGWVSDAGALPVDCVISAVTLAELSVGPHVATSEQERAARQAHLQQAEADFEVVPFDAAAGRAFGTVAVSLRAAGRKSAARAYDVLICRDGHRA
jgi:tRNA(fMet)-specific endonuclease VapC